MNIYIFSINSLLLLSKYYAIVDLFMVLALKYTYVCMFRIVKKKFSVVSYAWIYDFYLFFNDLAQYEVLDDLRDFLQFVDHWTTPEIYWVIKA